jgi:hypothetical protein
MHRPLRVRLFFAPQDTGNPMSTGELPTTNVIQLTWDDNESSVTVTTHDRQRFKVKMRKVVEVLQQSRQKDDFNIQFQLLLVTLTRWIEAHSAYVREGYVTLRDNSLAFVVVRSKCEYDDDFEDSLSVLDRQVAADVDLDLIQLNVMALPPVSEEALSAFLDQRLILSYRHHASSRRPHRARKPKPRRTDAPNVEAK